MFLEIGKISYKFYLNEGLLVIIMIFSVWRITLHAHTAFKKHLVFSRNRVVDFLKMALHDPNCWNDNNRRRRLLKEFRYLYTLSFRQTSFCGRWRCFVLFCYHFSVNSFVRLHAINSQFVSQPSYSVIYKNLKRKFVLMKLFDDNE